MAIFLTEADVKELFPMQQALERVESSFMQQHRGAVNRSRQRILLPNSSLQYMAAALPEEGLLGMKIYTVSKGILRFMVLLYQAENGELLALIEADHLGRMRTGAASGIATKYMARADARRVGMIGSGRQARTQLEAVARVRTLDAARIFSRNETRRREFCLEMTERLRIEVEPADSAEAAVRFGDVVITATSSRDPVLMGGWLRAGAHINAIGANMVDRREVDNETLGRSTLVAVDSLDEAREEAGDLVQGAEALPGGWDDVVELHEIVSGSRPGRSSSDDITLFKSSGIALWDVASARYIYQQAIAKGRGKKLDIWQ